MVELLAGSPLSSVPVHSQVYSVSFTQADKANTPITMIVAFFMI